MKILFILHHHTHLYFYVLLELIWVAIGIAITQLNLVLLFLLDWIHQDQLVTTNQPLNRGKYKCDDFCDVENHHLHMWTCAFSYHWYTIPKEWNVYPIPKPNEWNCEDHPNRKS